MTKSDREPDEHSRLVGLARVWLDGYARQQGDVSTSHRLEDDTALDRECRLALAQLLIDRSVPGDILDLLAVQIAPTEKLAPSLRLRRRGKRLARSGADADDLALTGSDWILRRVRRDNMRYTDPLLSSSVLSMLLEATDSGMSVEDACFDVSERLSIAGMRNISARNIRRIWNEAKNFRDFQASDTWRPSD